MSESQPPTDPYLPPADNLNLPSAGTERTSGWATTSLVLGVCGFCFWIFTGIPAIICGIIGLTKASQPGVGGKGLAIAGIVTGAVSTVFPAVPGILIALLLPAISSVRETAERTNSMSNMRQQSLAAMVFATENGHFPAAADTSQGPPVSWRTTLSPHFEAQHVYDQYNFQEAWDSDSNLPLVDEMPYVFRNPSLDEEAVTNYLALVGDKTTFPPGGETSTQVSPQTILFVEANSDRAVPWTEPKDINYDPAQPLAGLGEFRPGGFIATFSDGSAQMINNDIDPEVFRAMVNRSGEDN